MAWGDNNGSNNGGPWGQPGGGEQNRPKSGVEPDFDELIRKSKERIQGTFNGGSGKWLIILIVLAIVGYWMLQGFYEVNERENAVVLRLGEYNRTEEAGLQYHLPSPIEEVIIVNVQELRRLEIGFRSKGNVSASKNGEKVEIPEESLMLTGDKQIAAVPFEVQWVIKDAQNYVFKVRDPEATVKEVAESAMREVIGRNPIDSVLQAGGGFSADTQVAVNSKFKIQNETKQIMQRVLDDYNTGINIKEVQLGQVLPPRAVRDAYSDVVSATQEKKAAINRANAYAKEILPIAEGKAVQLENEAEAYEEQTVKSAEGEAARFVSIYDQYKNAKDITVQRMYLETLESVFSSVNKIIIDNEKGGSGVLPYLSLNELNKNKK